MRIASGRRPAAAPRRPFSSLSGLLTALLSIAPLSAHAINFTPAPAANLDLSSLGRVAIAGDFSGISLFQYEEQNENPISNNGSGSLLAPTPNGDVATIVTADASIQAMCSFVLKDGTMAGAVLGGNFTSLQGMESTAIALFNPNTSQLTPLPGLSGQVYAVLCDQDADTVYVGGNLRGANSTNAVAWVQGSGWTNLPFAGFNGPVTSITKASNGHVIFGGRFTGLGNASAPSSPDEQVINISSANITAGPSATTPGFGDPANIVCKTTSAGQEGGAGNGNTWLLEDNTPGFWQAAFGFGFEPSKIRLYNTHHDGRGTQTWRLYALPLNGILNLTYIDPATGRNASCSSECPLSDDPSVPYQDFHLVNTVGMDAFRIDISAWYGSGGGLDGIELFENDIFVYAIDAFNEPACADLSVPSEASTTGPWEVTPSHNSLSEYLTARIPAGLASSSSSSASVVFLPDITESGFYSVNMYTPGCQQDGTCAQRGQVNVTGAMAPPSGTQAAAATPLATSLYQTNDFDKYDQIYFGYVEASTDSFRPSVTLTPLDGGSSAQQNQVFVAQRVGFTMINSTGGLNGLFEYDPAAAAATAVNTSDFASSAFDRLGASFGTGSAVNALATGGDVVYIGGSFSSSSSKNIISVDSRSATTASLGGGGGGGLDGEVLTMYLDGTSLYAGGNFSTALAGTTAQGLSNVAVYDTSENAWSPLGAGVDGPVLSIAPMALNITGPTPEVVIALSGHFQQLNGLGTNGPAVPVSGFAIWVPSQSNWLQNVVNASVASVTGTLSASLLDVPGAGELYAGSLSMSTLGVHGAAVLTSTGTLGKFPVDIQSSSTYSRSSSGVTKRAAASSSSLSTSSNSTVSGVVTGTFDTNNGRNMTILAGHFTATATDGSTISNLLFLNGSSAANSVTGLAPGIAENSTFVALAVYADTLFAGGNVTGTVDGAGVNGLVSYDLATGTYNTQPPALSGGNNSVSSILVRPTTGDFYVGGSFTMAGSLGCRAVCVFSSGQWTSPGTNLAGSVSSMLWTSNTQLVAGGSLQVAGTPAYLASYDTGTQVWMAYTGAADNLPGPVDVVTDASSDGSQLWVAGTAPNGSVYLMKYDGKDWHAAGQTLQPGTEVKGLQMFSLTEDHDPTDLVSPGQVLMLTGSIGVPGFGPASAATYNGSALEPYALTMGTGGSSTGSIARIFVEKQNFFATSGRGLALGYIVLIGLGISLALIFLIVLAGLMLDRLRKRREGYVPAPTSMYDRGSGIQRIPPGQLLQSLGQGRPGAPAV